VAETSGFMTELPQSAYLSLSIRRAISAAQQRSHRYVTLEHLLLSLLDDPDAMALLEGVRADIAAIKVSAADTVNRNLATLYTPGQFDLRASYKVERVLQTASDDADRLNCQEVDAAFVLAAISRESDNPAADILKRNSFTYSAAMTWLYSNRGKSTGGRPAPKPTPAPASPPSSTSPAPQEAAPAQPAPLPAREGPGLTERLAAGENQDSELELQEVSEVEPKPDVKPSRESPQAPVPAAATRTAPSSPPAKPQVVPPFDDDDDDFYQDEKYSTLSQQQPYAQPRSREASEGGSGYAPASVPPPIPRRAELQVPSPARLDQMRVRPGVSRPQAPLTAPAPAPPPSPAPAPAPQPSAKQAKKRPLPAPAPAAAKGAAKSTVPDRAKGRQKRRPGPYDALLGRLIENIPRRMRTAVPERIEVRISREDSVTLGRGMEGRAEPVRHDIMVTQAMSVMLRSPDGGFNIEPLSPETQWIFERPEAADGETYGRWRWVVTPSETGQRRLQVIIAARSIDKNGLVGDTALPDQVITVRVRMNVLRSLGRGIQWLAAMILGGILTEIALIGMRILEK
jgi:hypothetical protein